MRAYQSRGRIQPRRRPRRRTGRPIRESVGGGTGAVFSGGRVSFDRATFSDGRVSFGARCPSTRRRSPGPMAGQGPVAGRDRMRVTAAVAAALLALAPGVARQWLPDPRP
ncbi:hypothetical protein SBD_5787 [Streptomyces bottropensis ATCC 25435]|uniref:Uncharacterized protein n=1 Tax=Streptomyces bottropensis ATCC 25435 TaxID=1054862 RepID=M3D8Z3_9ACTN|nr:hypothetical protein SBD_5787 [Streptomyces bottropensis ATCC 25435]